MLSLFVVSLKAEATGLEYRPDGDVQGGVRCIVSNGAMCGLQTKCGTSVFTPRGIGDPSLGATHSENHGCALCHQGLFGRRKEALHTVLCQWVCFGFVFLD